MASLCLPPGDGEIDGELATNQVTAAAQNKDLTESNDSGQLAVDHVTSATQEPGCCDSGEQITPATQESEFADSGKQVVPPPIEGWNDFYKGWGGGGDGGDDGQQDGVVEEDQADKSEDEQETEEQARDQRMPYMGAKNGINLEVVPSSSCYFALEGKHYGEENNRNLVFKDNISSPKWSIRILQNEDTIRGQLMIVGSIRRDMSVEHNPRQEKAHAVTIVIDPIHVLDCQVKLPGEFICPEAFGPVEGFQGKDIALI